jgi:hypothetical protein
VSRRQALSNASLQAAQAYVTLTGGITLATYPHAVPSTGDHTAGPGRTSSPDLLLVFSVPETAFTLTQITCNRFVLFQACRC